jgi:1,2-phenylacetyl-CoA epoxidase catalytic subunit
MAFVTDDNLFDVQPENLRASVEAAFASATETVAREREFEQSTGKEWLERLRS